MSGEDRAKEHGLWLFIDEVQEIDEWERAVNSFFAEGIADIVITGSNSRLLADEPATLLSGRFVEIPMYPLSFGEFLAFREAFGGGSRGDTEEEFRRYLRYGGMPEIHALELADEHVLPYLEAVVYLELRRRGYTVSVGVLGDAESNQPFSSLILRAAEVILSG